MNLKGKYVLDCVLSFILLYGVIYAVDAFLLDETVGGLVAISMLAVMLAIDSVLYRSWALLPVNSMGMAIIVILTRILDRHNVTNDTILIALLISVGIVVRFAKNWVLTRPA